MIPPRGKYLAPRHITKVQVIGGMHGNERTGMHAVQYILENPSEFTFGEVFPECLFGNPEAIQRNARYIEKDLNRCFKYDYASPQTKATPLILLEESRALEIREQMGALERPVDFVLDLHTTTSAMGNCLIVSDEDPWTELLILKLSSQIPDSHVLYEPITREEELTSSSLGLNHITLEMGPIPQGVAYEQRVKDTLSYVKMILNTIRELNGVSDLSDQLKSKSYFKFERTPLVIDYPRDSYGAPTAYIHPEFETQTYQPLQTGQPVFLDIQGREIFLEPGEIFLPSFCQAIEKEEIVPLFIGESAYVEKGLAFVTARKVWHHGI